MKHAILCVDDEKIVLDSLKTQIREHFGDRYIYEIAENADEAWEVIDELEDDGVRILIIVSDWLMPGIRGDEFLIRVHRKYPDIVKVMLTGQADQGSIERAREGADLKACLHKPWNREELMDIIEKGLGGGL